MGSGNVLFLGCIAAAVVSCSSCASTGAQGAGAATSRSEGREDRALLETECETQLLYFAARLDALDSNTAVPGAASARLKELRAMSEELYLKQEYALALTLIEEALQLIEEFGD